MTYYPNREAFAEKHGAHVVVGDFVLFENGARMENSRYGALYDPPADDYDRTKIIAQYWQEKVRRGTARFNFLKMQLKASNYHHGTVDDLRALQKETRTYQRKLNAANAELEAAMPLGMRDDRTAEDLERARRFHDEINSIKI